VVRAKRLTPTAQHDHPDLGLLAEIVERDGSPLA
jgi:hypothetical protein